MIIPFGFLKQIQPSGGGSIPQIESFTNNYVWEDDENTTAVAQTGTITLTKPTGIVADDLLLVIVGHDANISPPPETWDNATYKPTGFNLIDTAIGNVITDAHVAAFWRIATGDASDADVTFSADVSEQNTSQDLSVFGYYIRISGADTTTPIGVTSFLEDDLVEPVIIPEVTTVNDNSLIIATVAFNGSETYPYTTSGTGWSKWQEAWDGVGVVQAVGACVSTKEQATAGASGACTVTTGGVTKDVAALMFSINPAP